MEQISDVNVKRTTYFTIQTSTKAANGSSIYNNFKLIKLLVYIYFKNCLLYLQRYLILYILNRIIVPVYLTIRCVV